MPDPREPAFYARSVHEVARDLVGCILRHEGAAGRIVEKVNGAGAEYGYGR